MPHNPFDAGYFGSEELRTFGFKYVGENVRVAKNCVIHGLENIDLGDHSRIDGFCTIIALGGWLRLGRYAHVHTSVVLGCRGGIDLGDYVGVSHGTHMLSASDDFTGRWMTNSTLPTGCTNPKIAPITVGRHVPIGSTCTILPGVTIGEGAAVCAHSLVSRNVSEWTMVAGNPAVERCPRSRKLLAVVPRDDERQSA